MMGTTDALLDAAQEEHNRRMQLEEHLATAQKALQQASKAALGLSPYPQGMVQGIDDLARGVGGARLLSSQLVQQASDRIDQLRAGVR